MKTKILTGLGGRKKIMVGIEKAAKIIGSTLGPGGKNCMYESEYSQRVDVSDEMYDSEAPVVTNDGVRIMSKIKLDDPFEDMGCQALFEVSKQQNTEAGDATTTVVVIAHKLIQSIINQINDTPEDVQTANRMEIKKELQEAQEDVIKQLKVKAKKITKLSELENIAFTASENSELSKKMAEAWWKIGKDGYVGITGWKGYETITEIHDGMKINAKLMSEYMRTNNKGELEVNNPLVIVTNHEINNSEQIKGWIQAGASQLGTEIILFAPKFSTKAMEWINTARVKVEGYNKTNKQKAIRLFAIKVPSLTEKEGGQLEDLAIFSGATMIDSNSNMNMEDIKPEYFGNAVKVFCDNDSAIIGAEKNPEIKKRIKRLTEEMENETDDMFKGILQRRIGALASGMATIKVGATTDTERRYDKLKLDDATSACKNALQHGYIAGAGQVMKELKTDNEHLKKALEAPYKKIIENAGKIEIPKTIIDPVLSEIIAIERAISMASMIISTDTFIVYDKETIEDKVDKLSEALKGFK